MIISGFSKLTLLDYPGKMACMLFTQGCNWKCKFCQNSDLIHYDKDSLISKEEIFDYIEKRKKMLDGIVISGGEPTMQPDLIEFIKELKERSNLLIKLDTNGSTPSVLKTLLDEHLVDYVAMDIKNVFEEYEPIVNVKKINIDNIKQSINMLKESNIDHEFRTTIMKNYHTLDKIKNIISYVGNDKYYLQNFEDSDGVLDKTITSYTKEELKSLAESLMEYPNVKIRGL